MAAVPLF